MNCCSNETREWIEPVPEILVREAEIIKDLVSSIDFPAAGIDRIVVGPKAVAVLSEGRVGVSARLGARAEDKEAGLSESLLNGTVVQAAELLHASTPFSRCVGLAACNAGLKTEAQSSDQRAEDLIAELGRGKRVSLVGYFPFTEKLRQQVGTLNLFELCKAPGAVPREEWDDVLADTDILAVTGTSILTRHLAYFLDRTPHAFRIVLGPSTPLSTALFAHGAHVLAGSVIVDAECVLDCVERGYSFKRIKAEGGLNFVRLTN